MTTITATPRRLHWLGFSLLLALALVAVVRSAVGTQRDSFTVDEAWHIVAGTTYVRGGGFHLNPEHPPLVKLWIGAAMPDDFRLRPAKVLSEKTQEREWVEQTMFFDNDPLRAQARARMAMWAFHGVLLLALGLALWRAFGLPWAAGSLAFLAIEPTVGAHLPVVMTDLPLALTLMLAAVCAGMLAATWRWHWVIGCGLAVGLSLAAKHSALAGLLGIAFALATATQLGWRTSAREAGRRTLRLLACGAIALALLWSMYGLRFHAGSDGSDAFNRPMAGKVAELKLPHWRNAIAFADREQLLPRSYLWGLADTVRTGVEGRGIGMHFVWGKVHYGNPPWFSWPAILAAKLPLGLMAMLLIALPWLWRGRLPTTARWALSMVAAGCAFHMWALVGSGGIWGGVRHALPVIVGAAVLAGGAVAWACQQRSRPLFALTGGALAATVLMTAREPRLWEYHNELVGGTSNAYRYFGNEGLDLGQRFHELRRFHDTNIVPSGEPMYLDYWVGEQQLRAARLNFRKRVESLQDTNVEGIYRGWFVYPMNDTLRWPQWDWDPAVVFKDMRLVARFGHIGVWHGSLRRPQTRAGALFGRVSDYIYKENGQDWTLVAARLEEVVAQLPAKVDAGVELGNAYLRLGQRERALAAYEGLLQQDKIPVEPMIARQLKQHIERVRDAHDLARVEPMRNPWLE